MFSTNVTSFEHLLSLIGTHLQRTRTRIRETISATERVALTQKFLVSGDSQQSLCFSFRICGAAIWTIQNETYEKLWEVLTSFYVRAPNTVLQWKKMSKKIIDILDMPHCIGALDVQHIVVEYTGNSGSLYYNYKGFFSLILMAVCDAKYTFNLVDIGSYGSNHDCGILTKSLTGKKFFLAGFSSNPLNDFLGSNEIFSLR